MLVALRDFSLGEEVIDKGTCISPEAQASLPAGRVEVLKTHRFVEEVSDGYDLRGLVAALEARVTKLEHKLDGRRKQVA